jgi:spore coat protein U-like protein
VKQTLIAVFGFLISQLALTSQASAQSCSATVAVNFGTINLTTGGSVAISGTVNVTCSGTAGSTVRACPGIGSPRLMTRSAGGQIAYELYSDAAHTTVWGSTAGSPSPPQVDVSLGAGGSGAGSTTIYGLISAGQSGAPTTNANPNYAHAPTVLVGSAYTTGDPTCAAISAANSAAGTASIQATYPPACTLAVNPLAFGTLASTVTAVDQSTTIQTHCSGGTPYTVSMNGGLTNAANPEAREMQKGVDTLVYGLYRDSGHTQPWGIGAQAASSNGSGSSQSIPVYGRVQAQPTPPSGNYTDTVIVTVDY